MFFRPWDSLLGSRSRVRLLRVLLGAGRPLSGREAARLASTSLPLAQRALAQLTAAGVVLREEAAAQHLYRPNDEHLLVRDGLRPLFAAEDERVRATFDAIEHVLGGKRNSMDSGALSAYLFGSAARGDDSPGSDFDLLVVAPDPPSADELHDLLSSRAAELRRRFGIVLSPVVIDAEAARRQSSDERGVVRAALREGRHVHGVPLEEIVDGDAGEEKAR